MTQSVAAMVIGAVIGLSIAMPFGPVGLICIRRSLTGGLREGLACGMGAATAHGMFFSAAVTGAGMASAALGAWHPIIRIVSAAILIGLGLRTVLRRGPTPQSRVKTSRIAAFAGVLFLALSNPMTILPYAAFASTRAEQGGTADNLGWMVAGDVLATLAWYATLCLGARMLHDRLGGQASRSLNLMAGSVLIGFGALSLLR